MSEAWRQEYSSKLTNVEEAVQTVKSGDRVYIGTASSVAAALTNALGNRTGIADVTICSGLLAAPYTFMGKPNFRVLSYFMGAEAKLGPTVDYTSFGLSEMAKWYNWVAKPDVAFIEVSAPDANGNMCLGLTGITSHLEAVKASKRVILEVNSKVPFLFGEQNTVTVADADMIVEADNEPPCTFVTRITDPDELALANAISGYINELVPDGSALQCVSGNLFDEVIRGMKNKNELGCSSEAYCDPLMELQINGNITNTRKQVYPGKSTFGIAFGTKKLYEYLDHNDQVYALPLPRQNDPREIAKNDNAVAINTCICMDLTGQVAAENSGRHQHSGVGGLLEWTYGAQMSKNGKSVFAFASQSKTSKGQLSSKIVAEIPVGMPVTVPRSLTNYVVTEYGSVNLKALPMRERVRAMISVAHPDYRDQLTEEAKSLGYL